MAFESIQLINAQTVQLRLNNWKSGILYELKIKGVKDCSANEILPTSMPFGKGKIPDYEEVIITEIMADPSPSAGLPESEYIEIY